MPRDNALIDRINPEQPSAAEREWMERIGVADYSVYVTKLELICEEAKQVLVNTSSSLVSQTNDCIVGIYTAAGDLALASVGTYLHVATGIVPVKYILKYFRDNSSIGVNDGDSFFCNEALYGGIHNADQINLMPIFWEGELVAWACAAAHIHETGGSDPGGMAPFARSRYEEGLKAPPVKVGANFQIKTDVMTLLANHVRDEELMWTDMKARVLACLRVRQRLLELMGEKGPGFLQGLLRKTVEEVSRSAHKVISELPDGTFRQTVFLDNAGAEQGLRVVHVAAHKKGGKLTVDLSGSSPYTQSFINSKPHIMRAQLAGDLMMFLFADFPASTAILAPLEIKAPENTWMNAPDDCAIAGNMRIIPMVVNATHVCLSKMLYIAGRKDYVTTARAIHGGVVPMGGVNQYGKPFSWIPVTTICAGGNGAATYQDGNDAGHFWWAGYSDSLDAEHQEIQFPYLVLAKRMARDVAGAGKYRGGAGVTEVWAFHDLPKPTEVIWGVGAQGTVNCAGLSGGYHGGLSTLIVLRGVKKRLAEEGAKAALPLGRHDALDKGGFLSEAMRTPVDEGDVFVFNAGSSGGYGDVLDRDPQLVAQDVQKAIVSPWAARNVYHVALTGDTFDVDLEATRELREQERKRRLAQGQAYADFEQEWLKLKPREDLLRYYGPWPQGIE